MHHPAGGASPQQGPKKRVIPFGKYLLLDRIAVGGMAEVFLAKSFGIEGFEKIIAIKRILPTMAEDDDFIEMFIDEAKIAGHLNQANIVPIYELGKIGDSHYIAMEYVWGKDLLQIMNRFRKMRKRMPPAMVAHIAGRMCEALEYAHSKRDRRGNPLNLIHRDISPQNILVSYDGAVKLIDFGIAKAASRTTKTQAGVLKGKFGYMSPEQVRGLPIDHRSDIFAVGTCMYEMLTADRLFTGESDFSTLEKVRHAQVAPPSQVVAGVPQQFDDILMRALARDPADRWQTAGELHEALQEFLVTQRPPFTSGKLSAWMSTAFAKELEKEKDKLDSYAHVGRPSVAGGERRSAPSASGPRPTKAPPPRLEGSDVEELDPSDLVEETSDHDVFDTDELQGEATMITASPFDAMQEEAESEELEAEATQIFFSAEDLEELGAEEVEEDTRAFSTGPRARLQQQVPLGGVPGPRPVPGAAAGSLGSVDDQRATTGPGEGGLMAPPSSGPSFSMPPGAPSKQPQRQMMPTAEMPRVDPDEGKGKKIALMIVAAIVMIAVGVGGAYLAFGGPGHGTIEVRTVPDVGAEVRVDGIPRGVAPVRVDGIEEGSRVVTIVAPGYRAVQRDVQVGAGGTAMIDVVLISDPNSQVASASESEQEEEEEEEAEEAPSEEEEEASEEEEEEELAANEAEEEVEEEEEEEEAPSTMRVANSGGSVMRIQRDPEPSGIMRIQRNTGGGSMTNARGRGTIVINTIPWARVFVDGRDTGQNTPVRNLRISAGSHRIGLRTADGTMHNVNVEVNPGETVRLMRRL